MRITKWFEEGTPIPDGAVFLKLERRIVGQDSDYAGAWDVWAGGAVYEISISQNEEEK